MKNKNITMVVLITAGLIITGFYLKNISTGKSRLVVQSVRNLDFFLRENSKALAEQEEHDKTLKTIDEAGESIRMGNSYYKEGRYEEAVQLYKKAYELDPGDRVFSGLKMINAYEQMNKYSDALTILDELSNASSSSDYGIKKFEAIRSRLLAAKAQSLQNQAVQSS